MTQKIEVIRYDMDANGYATSRKPVTFDNVEEAIKYVRLVRQAIDKWKDNSLVGLDVDGKCIKVD